jgi:hypothetical protein
VLPVMVMRRAIKRWHKPILETYLIELPVYVDKPCASDFSSKMNEVGLSLKWASASALKQPS